MNLPLNICDWHHPAIAFLGEACPICAIADAVDDNEWDVDRQDGEACVTLTSEMVLAERTVGVAGTAVRHDLEQALKESYGRPE